MIDILNKKVFINFFILLLFLVFLISMFILHSDLKEYEESVNKYESIYEESVYEISESDLTEYKSVNSDFIGYLYIPDTKISFPVVKGEDNSYYLKHTFTKERNAVGCPFVDYRTEIEDQNKVIHAHNMGHDETVMFSTLIEYQNEDYYLEHPYIYFAELGVDSQEYKIFSVLNFNVNKLAEFDYMKRKFESHNEFIDWIGYLQSNSMFKIDELNFSEDSQVLILSTCNRAYGSNNRLLICAVKIEI